MINRELIRIKVVQLTYAYYQNGNKNIDTAEKELAARLGEISQQVEAALAREDFTAAGQSAAGLRQPVDRFFDDVTVNAENAALRANRLKLLSGIRNLLDRQWDLSKIEG